MPVEKAQAVPKYDEFIFASFCVEADKVITSHCPIKNCFELHDHWTIVPFEAGGLFGVDLEERKLNVIVEG